MDFNISNLTNFPQQSMNFFNDIGSNPFVIVVLAVIIGIYYLIFALLGNSSGNSNNGSSIVFVEALLWGVFIILILVNGITYFFNIDVSSSIENIFSDTPEISVRVNNRVGDIGSNINTNNRDNTGDNTGNNTDVRFMKGNEVFNIPGNHYSYLDAEALCRAFDGELATYGQIL